MTAADRRFVLGILLYAALLAVMPLVLSGQPFEQLFSEEGPFEIVSVAFWLLAAAVIFVRIRPLGMRAWAFALVYIAFAAREADWHKAFTADSMLKSAYYRRVAAPFEEKLIAGLVAVALLGLLAYVAVVAIRFLRRERGWRSRAGGWLLAGGMLLVFCKVLDRMPAVLFEDYGIEIAPLVKMYFSAFEEGLEAVVPLLLAWSAWISQDERRYLS